MRTNRVLSKGLVQRQAIHLFQESSSNESQYVGKCQSTLIWRLAHRTHQGNALLSHTALDIGEQMTKMKAPREAPLLGSMAARPYRDMPTGERYSSRPFLAPFPISEKMESAIATRSLVRPVAPRKSLFSKTHMTCALACCM